MHIAVRPLPNIPQLLLTNDLGEVISIDMLSDDVLLAIFGFYVDEASNKAFSKKSLEEWQSLIHVCRRWRTIVFESPRRLNLRLCCTPKTREGYMRRVWPALPLVICGRDCQTGSMYDITCILGHRDRVCQIDLWKLSGSHWERILAAMQVPFPELTDLDLRLQDYDSQVSVPHSFLGGSAPRLRSLRFNRIPFPSLPTLLLSTTHLVTLRLHEIPQSGYIPPEVMVTTLSTLTCLRFLSLTFQFFLSGLNWESRHPPPSTRPVLPILTFSFNGAKGYFEEMVARIDAPRINELSIDFFNEILFERPHFIQFINRTPTLNTFKTARLFFLKGRAKVELISQTPGSGVLSVNLSVNQLNWQVSSLKDVCASCLPLLSTLEDLYISEYEYSRLRRENVENTLWLGLLHLFTSVKNLYLSEQVAKRIVPALQGLVRSRTTDVLPTLQNIFLEGLQPSGPIPEGIGKFVARRQVASHPLAVSRWENPFKGFSLGSHTGQPCA